MTLKIVAVIIAITASIAGAIFRFGVYSQKIKDELGEITRRIDGIEKEKENREKERRRWRNRLIRVEDKLGITPAGDK